jgi:hypothetical protein
MHHILKQAIMKKKMITTKTNIVMLMSCIILVSNATAMAQFGEIRGVVKDKISGDIIPGVIAYTYVNGKINTTSADSSGFYKIKPLPVGTYDVRFSFLGYDSLIVKNVRVSEGEYAKVNAELNSGNELPEAIIHEYINPLLPAHPDVPIVILGEDIEHAVDKRINSLVASTAKTFQSDSNEPISIAGSRYSSTKYYVDGMRVDGEPGIPGSAIEQISVYAGAIPASYGDSTGGLL